MILAERLGAMVDEIEAVLVLLGANVELSGSMVVAVVELLAVLVESLVGMLTLLDEHSLAILLGGVAVVAEAWLTEWLLGMTTDV